jgi:hypothetical protein
MPEAPYLVVAPSCSSFDNPNPAGTSPFVNNVLGLKLAARWRILASMSVASRLPASSRDPASSLACTNYDV